MRHQHSILLFFLILFSLSIEALAQYTETINSNRPGASQGAFSVGRRVLQLETGIFFGEDDHIFRRTESDIFGIEYSLRYGFLFEALEVSLTGSFQDETTAARIGSSEIDFAVRDFKTNTLGIKYLIFDPWKELEPDTPNLYSWKANQRFKWKTLIPAVAVFVGANFSYYENPYLFQDESLISPKILLSTQNNWNGGWVLVTNLIADKITEDNPTYAAIITLTHAFTPRFVGFLEYQGITSDIYADDIFRTGLAYLFSKNFQVDVSGLINFKDTPDRWQLAAGISYRLDWHKQDEYLEESTEGDLRRSRTQSGENLKK